MDSSANVGVIAGEQSVRANADRSNTILQGIYYTYTYTHRGVGSTGAPGAGAHPYLKLPYLYSCSMKFRISGAITR